MMSSNPIEQQRPEDLDWLAFQYAAGELSGAELDAFERLLATDDHACAALARAVMLGQTVVHCEQRERVEVQPVSSISTSTAVGSARTPYRWLTAVSTVACSLLFMGWVLMQQPGKNVSPESASVVAQLWIEAADEDSAQETLLAESDTAELIEDEAAPDWLLAALNEQQAGEDEDVMND